MKECAPGQEDLSQHSLSSRILKTSFPVSSLTLYLLTGFIPQQALRDENVGDKNVVHLILLNFIHEMLMNKPSPRHSSVVSFL